MIVGGQEEDTWPFIASIIYTAAWCISFYGQIYENWKLKSVQGFSLDYLVFNITGYTFYIIYSSVGYFTDIKGAGTVVIADLVFVYHAALMVVIETIQCIIYERGKNKISKAAIIIISILWLVEILATLLYLTGAVQYYQYWNPITALGYGKLVITLIKYTPPAVWNCKRKSTKGWSIFNIILDLFGGIFSMASGGLSVENGLNVTKVILGFITIIYDLIFCFQHYCLFRNREKQDINNKNEEAKLLADDREEQLSVESSK